MSAVRRWSPSPGVADPWYLRGFRRRWLASSVEIARTTNAPNDRPFDVREHPVLDKPPSEKGVTFFFDKKPLLARGNEVLSTALTANGIRTFGNHPRDGSPQGLYCANGTCSQCLVLVNGVPKKACMTHVRPGVDVMPLQSLPHLGRAGTLPNEKSSNSESKLTDVDALVIGGGPSGLAAALELGRRKAKVILVDDKDRLGGKLVLQTHKFFGSVDDSDAGERGFAIAEKLAKQVKRYPNIEVWNLSTVLGLFQDQTVGILRSEGDQNEYLLVRPRSLIVATGARERFRTFPGNTLPGVLGAGAFQTLLNRDRVLPGRNVLVVGGGNVGLLVAYHALQAGARVAGVVRSGRQSDAYDIHVDKLRRLGVPFYEPYAVKEVRGSKRVEGAKLGRIDPSTRQFVPGGDEIELAGIDCVLLSVGLESTSEFFAKARDMKFNVFSAGDAQEIAEASSARFSGQVSGLHASRSLGLLSTKEEGEFMSKTTPLLEKKAEILKSKPGRRRSESEIREVNSPRDAKEQIPRPILHCHQEIPCDVCDTICPSECMSKTGHSLMGLPVLHKEKNCVTCLECVYGCPGLAITVVDNSVDFDRPAVYVPVEFSKYVESDKAIKEGDILELVDRTGTFLCKERLQDIMVRGEDQSRVFKFQVPVRIADQVAGVRLQHLNGPGMESADREIKECRTRESKVSSSPGKAEKRNDPVVCRCERVRESDIMRTIKERGVVDVNQLKALTRVGMGACAGKSCGPLVNDLLRRAGVSEDRRVPLTNRPLFSEAPLGVFAQSPSHIRK